MAIKRVAEGKKKTLKKVFKIHCINKHERSKKKVLLQMRKELLWLNLDLVTQVHFCAMICQCSLVVSH